jgi:hypothetical protein
MLPTPEIDGDWTPIRTASYLARQEFSVSSGRYNPALELDLAVQRGRPSRKARPALSLSLVYPRGLTPLFRLALMIDRASKSHS